MFVAGAIGGMMTLMAIYGARPEAQPSVLAPWPLFAVGMVMIAAVEIEAFSP
jgi:hypothetical protein